MPKSELPKETAMHYIKLAGVLIAAISLSGGSVAAYYSGKDASKTANRAYTDKKVDEVRTEICPRLDIILRYQIKNSEDMGKVKGKLNLN